MKVLLFTHEQDIDGLGNVILAQQAFKEVDYIPCKTFEITKKVKEQIDNKKIYNYDFIFVTDLCIKEPVLTEIDKDNFLKHKIIILDHHKSEIEEGNNKYDFVNIIVENVLGKTSGTSLFYNYLLEKRYITRTSFLDELVELTRQYDTWEWYTKYNNKKARMLHILFEAQGYKKYISMINEMLIKNSFEFEDWQLNIIEEYEGNLKEELSNLTNKMIIKEININDTTYKIGFIKISYRYRNEFADIIKENKLFDIDAVGMIMKDIDTVSYRAVTNIDVSNIATYFGGKGHKSAASNPQSDEKFLEILKLFN